MSVSVSKGIHGAKKKVCEKKGDELKKEEFCSQKRGAEVEGFGARFTG